ncbi:MAG TPA: hypothetical protein VGL55_02480 [Steroidobacteraceae bacterium]
MHASRPSGQQPYGIWVTAVARPPVALTLFRMTQAEARLAVCLAAGKTLRAAANQLGITYGTARTRLIQLFRKTNTRSQGRLIRLLLTCCTAQSLPIIC